MGFIPSHSVHCTYYTNFLRSVLIFSFIVSLGSQQFLPLRFSNFHKKGTNDKVSDYQEHLGLWQDRRGMNYVLQLNYFIVMS
jgi:hypothetical protein